MQTQNQTNKQKYFQKRADDAVARIAYLKKQIEPWEKAVRDFPSASYVPELKQRIQAAEKEIKDLGRRVQGYAAAGTVSGRVF